MADRGQGVKGGEAARSLCYYTTGVFTEEEEKKKSAHTKTAPFAAFTTKQ